MTQKTRFLFWVEKNAENFHQKAKLSPFPSFGKKTPHVQKKGGCDELFFSLSLSLGKDDERGRAIGERGGRLCSSSSWFILAQWFVSVFSSASKKRGENERSGDAVAIDCFTATAVAPVDVFVVVVTLDEERDARKARRKRR